MEAHVPGAVALSAANKTTQTGVESQPSSVQTGVESPIETCVRNNVEPKSKLVLDVVVLRRWRELAATRHYRAQVFHIGVYMGESTVTILH